MRGALTALLCVLAINGFVRAVGDGYPHPLSPLYLPEKVEAIGALARHVVRQIGLQEAAAPADAVRRAARRHAVPPTLLLAIAEVESGLRPLRISHAGAMGLMQLMPATAAHYGVEDPYDVTQAATGAARFVRWLSKRYGGNHERVAAAYNAGPGRVARTGQLHLPAETRVYVRRVLHTEARLLGQSRATTPPQRQQHPTNRT